jgi:hypothetical protein
VPATRGLFSPARERPVVTDEDGAVNANPAADDGTDRGPTPVADLDRADRRELALDLLAHLELSEPSLAAVVDRIETVTTDPALTREILDAADRRGLIERADGRVRLRRGGRFVRLGSDVVAREGEFECRRCGAGLSTGHFLRFETGELGPFGSACVRKVTGRD